MERIMQKMEFLLNASPIILYDYISNTSNLTQWFCEDLKVKDQNKYFFIWEGEERWATVEKKVSGKSIRWSWDDAPKGEYVEMAVVKDDMTGDVLIHVTDFCNEDDEDANYDLWETDIEQLGGIVGIN